jgi:lactate dehydrogenase-like 2-hydroxyacid dehydrogenase
MGRRRAGDVPSGLAMAVACATSGAAGKAERAERMKPLDVLMPAAGMGVVAELIEERLPLHRLWLEPDRDAWIAEHGPSVRAIVSAGGDGRIDEALMRRLPSLEIVASFGVGYDHVDARWAGERGIIVTHTPGVLDDEVADVAMALTIMAVRQLPQAERYLRAGKWLNASFPLTGSLRGRTMGILGLGRIGKAVARRAEAFGLTVAYHSRRAQSDVPYRRYASLTAMAQDCDILMITAPGGPETRHMVNGEVLSALGPDGVLVNIARGSLVDERALIEALRSNTILAAGLDVFDNEPKVPAALIALDNVVLLPHVGSASVKTRHAMAQCVLDNLLAWSEGKPPLNPVPETPWRGAWGPATGTVVDVMKGVWDLPADCNDGELFAYAEVLCDRIPAGAGRDDLYAFLADVQVGKLGLPASDAYRAIVDQAVALAGTAG